VRHEKPRARRTVNGQNNVLGSVGGGRKTGRGGTGQEEKGKKVQK